MKRALLLALLLTSLVPVRVLSEGSVKNTDEVVLYGPTGTELLRDCSDVGALKIGETVSPTRLADVARHAAICSGYIAGVNDEAISYGANLKPPKLLYCVPPKAEMEQLIRVVKKWLEDNPSMLHLPSSFLVIDALKEAFPCSQH